MITSNRENSAPLQITRALRRACMHACCMTGRGSQKWNAFLKMASYSLYDMPAISASSSAKPPCTERIGTCNMQC